MYKVTLLEFLDREKFKSFTIMSLAAFILTIEEFSLQPQTLMFPTIEKKMKQSQYAQLIKL